MASFKEIDHSKTILKPVGKQAFNLKGCIFVKGKKGRD